MLPFSSLEPTLSSAASSRMAVQLSRFARASVC